MEAKKIIEELLLERDAEMVHYSTDEAIKSHKERCDYLIGLLDKQEQGLLIELPCKVGDTVWGLINYCNDCHEYTDYCHRGCEKPRYRLKDFIVNHFEIHNNGLRVSALSHYDGEGMWGKNVFLTRSEAEEALAKMGE